MSSTCRIADLLAYGRERLPAETAGVDLRTLIASVAGVDAARQFAFPELELPSDKCHAVRQAIERRVGGEPVAYILGYRDFWKHRFRVSPATLIPRPETEQLVEWALALLPAEPAVIADLGTGSGAIALSIAVERPDCRMLALDMSPQALAIARANRHDLGLGNVLLVQGNWASALGAGKLDLIVSNPPYVRADDAHLSRGDLRFEPESALAAGRDGLTDFRQLIPQAYAALRPGGWLLVEHGYDQAEAVARLMRLAGFVSVELRHDYAGQPRNTAGQKPVT